MRSFARGVFGTLIAITPAACGGAPGNTALCAADLSCQVRPCTTGADCTTPGSTCVPVGMIGTTPVMGCLGDFICQQQCDSTHACPTGQKCFPYYQGLPNGAGYCIP